MKKFLLLVFILAFSFSGCSPDQIIANELQGDWTSTARTRNGQNELVAGDSWRFDACSNVSQNNCTGTYSYPSIFGTITTSFVYQIYNNGTKFSIDFAPNSYFTDVSDANIVEHSATIIRINFTQNGDYYEQTLTKK